jgi:hypothetical protein
MLWICSERRICLREYHGTIERIMLPISTSVGETTGDVTQITKFADGRSYFTPSKISETFLTPTICEGNHPHHHTSNPSSPYLINRPHPSIHLLHPYSPITHASVTRLSSAMRPLFTPHIYFNLSGLGYLIESFFRGCLSFFRGPPAPIGREHPTFAYTSRKILCICFSFESCTIVVFVWRAGGAGMDLHEPFFIFYNRYFLTERGKSWQNWRDWRNIVRRFGCAPPKTFVFTSRNYTLVPIVERAVSVIQYM